MQLTEHNNRLIVISRLAPENVCITKTEQSCNDWIKLLLELSLTFMGRLSCDTQYMTHRNLQRPEKLMFGILILVTQQSVLRKTSI